MTDDLRAKVAGIVEHAESCTYRVGNCVPYCRHPHQVDEIMELLVRREKAIRARINRLLDEERPDDKQ